MACVSSSKKLTLYMLFLWDNLIFFHLLLVSLIFYFVPFLWQPECSALLDAIEQSACNPEIAIVLAKSLYHMLNLSAEKTTTSFKTLDAVPRVLKVACIQAQEAKRSGNTSPSIHSYQRSDSSETAQGWHQCMETCMELFMEFWSTADDARSFVLHNSTSIDCLFDLFWEEGFRNNVLKYILDLMKVFFFSSMCWLVGFFLINLFSVNRTIPFFFHVLRLCHRLRKIKQQSCNYVRSI